METYAVPPALKNRYRLLEQIGQGGMAAVYRAHDETLQREVAIKFLAPHLLAGDDEASTRFLREARTIARLAHPHIVTLYDADREGAWHYLVLEYIAGQDLAAAAAARGGKLALDEALSFVRDTLSGLAYAHAAGVIHRDIKPQNLLLTAVGSIKIADFGLALAQNDLRLTRAGALVGTPLYLAPEVVLEKPVDARTDLYAVGVVLYELLTGQPPFKASSASGVLSQILHAPIPAPRDSNPYIPAEIERIILTLLAKNPDERFPSAEAVLEALRGSDTPGAPSSDETLTQELLLYSAREDSAAAVEKERRRLAKRLESEIIEPLNLMLAQAGMYEQSLATNPQARMAASVMASLARQALQQARDLSANLHPTILESLGLEPALEALAGTLRARGIQTLFLLERQRERLPAAVELALFRAAQDALERAVTYARAAQITLRLEHSGEHFSFSISDNGVVAGGLELLENARQRIQQIGGRSETRWHEDGGLELLITLRLEAPVQLTPREIEVLQLLADGLSNKAIARKLSLSPRTVNFHLDNIYAKLGVNSRTEAAIYALRRGWSKRPR